MLILHVIKKKSFLEQNVTSMSIHNIKLAIHYNQMTGMYFSKCCKLKKKTNLEMECKLHNTGQGSGEVSRSASFSKLRESLRRSSVRLFHRIAGRHSAHLPDVDFTDPDRFVYLIRLN